MGIHGYPDRYDYLVEQDDLRDYIQDILADADFSKDLTKIIQNKNHADFDAMAAQFGKDVIHRVMGALMCKARHTYIPELDGPHDNDDEVYDQRRQDATDFPEQ